MNSRTREAGWRREAVKVREMAAGLEALADEVDPAREAQAISPDDLIHESHNRSRTDPALMRAQAAWYRQYAEDMERGANEYREAVDALNADNERRRREKLERLRR